MSGSKNSVNEIDFNLLFEEGIALERSQKFTIKNFR